MPTLFEPVLSRIVFIFLMTIPTLFLSIASFFLRLVGRLPVKPRHMALSNLANPLLYILFLGGFVLYADLIWTALPPHDIFPNSRSMGFLEAFWWLIMAWWSALVGASILWKADIQRSWLRRGIVALTIAYPALQTAYTIPVFIRQGGRAVTLPPEWIPMVIAAAFWAALLILLLRHRYQVDKEIKTAESAPVGDKNNSVQP